MVDLSKKLRESLFLKLALLIGFLLTVMVVLFYSYGGFYYVENKINTYLCDQGVKQDCVPDLLLREETMVQGYDPRRPELALYTKNAVYVSSDDESFNVLTSGLPESFVVANTTKFGISLHYKEGDETEQLINELSERYGIKFTRQLAPDPNDRTKVNTEGLYIGYIYPIDYSIFKEVVSKGDVININYNKGSNILVSGVLLEMN